MRLVASVDDAIPALSGLEHLID